MKKNDGKNTGVLEREPDIEAVFEFCGVRKAPASDGYRPGHLIKEGYITSGVHHYYNQIRGRLTELQREPLPLSHLNTIPTAFGREKGCP